MQDVDEMKQILQDQSSVESVKKVFVNEYCLDGFMCNLLKQKLINHLIEQTLENMQDRKLYHSKPFNQHYSLPVVEDFQL